MKETLIAALRIAGEELLKYFGKNLDFEEKESQSSIVTKADLKSDSMIVNFIENNFPSHRIISEESGYKNKPSEYTWVIDPLDGTSNFASAVPWFGTLITLFENDYPIMGGAYLPIQELLYFAEKGKGAYKNGVPFNMGKNLGLKNSLITFAVDFTDDEKVLDASINIYRNLVKSARNIRCTNSLVDFLYVAEGKFGGCINLFTRVWDISGLGLIISEAGGVMKDINGEGIKYKINKKIVTENFAVMAGSEKLIEEIKQEVLNI
jgi:myo-inositol-1(or 4)-monophosphatase